MKTRCLYLVPLVCATLPLLAQEAQQQETEAERIRKAQQLLDQMAVKEKVRRQERKFMASKLTEAGREFLKKKNYKKAILLLKKAIELEPDDKECQELLREARAKAGLQGGSTQELFQRVLEERKVARQMTRHELSKAMAKGKLLFKQKKYEETVEMFEKANTLAQWVTGMEGVEAEAKSAIEHLNLARQEIRRGEATRDKKADEEAREILSRERRRQQNIVGVRKKILTDRARRAIEGGHFLLAMNLSEEVLSIDPMNAEVKELRNQIMRGHRTRRSQSSRKNMKESSNDLLLQIEDAMSPATKLSSYPKNWADIIRKRPTSLAQKQELSAWEKNVYQQLEKRVSFDFLDTPLADVIAFLQNLTGVNMVLDPGAVEGDDTPITLKVEDMRLAAALDWILRLVDLKYALRDEALFVSSPDRLEDKTVLRFYDVRDLLAQIPDFAGTDVPTIGEGGGGGGGGGDIFGGEGEEDGITGEDLLELIQNTVAPDSWGDDDDDF